MGTTPGPPQGGPAWTPRGPLGPQGAPGKPPGPPGAVRGTPPGPPSPPPPFEFEPPRTRFGFESIWFDLPGEQPRGGLGAMGPGEPGGAGGRPGAREDPGGNSPSHPYSSRLLVPRGRAWCSHRMPSGGEARAHSVGSILAIARVPSLPVRRGLSGAAGAQVAARCHELVAGVAHAAPVPRERAWAKDAPWPLVLVLRGVAGSCCSSRACRRPWALFRAGLALRLRPNDRKLRCLHAPGRRGGSSGGAHCCYLPPQASSSDLSQQVPVSFRYVPLSS